jgi:two-component system sensor histidine kinase KdpD
MSLERAAYLRAAATVAIAAGICLALRPVLRTTDVAMLLLLGVVAVAARSSLGPALLASALSILAFNFGFVPPYYSLAVHDTAYLLTFAVMFVVAVVMSRLTSRIRDQAREARERAHRSAGLYALSRELGAAEGRAAQMAVAERHLGAAVAGSAQVVLGDDPPPTTGLFESLNVSVAAAWVREHGEPAGWGTHHCAEAEALVVPLRTGAATVGVAAVQPGDTGRALAGAEWRMIEALTEQAAIALERTLLAERHEQARLEVEAERLRTALLSSLSHDLRTPLASIEGAASSLQEDAASLPAESRRELAGAIVEESRRMSRLITNLLDMIRLETGALAATKAWQPLEETLGVALLRLEERLAEHPVETCLPAGLPLVPIDELLIEHLFINLLENAARHTPPGTRVAVGAWREGEAVVVEVSDRGPGVPRGEEDAVFEKFYRAGNGTPGSGSGSGLGLTICRGIVAAHGGRIWVDHRLGGGAVFRFTLPLDGPPMPTPPSEP